MTMHRRQALLTVPGLVAAFAVPTRAAFAGGYGGEGGVDLDVPYVPTPQQVVDGMLKLGKVTKNDILYDLGCGDGRIVVTAARDYGIKKGVGVDLDPDRIADSNKNAERNKVTDKVSFVQADLFKFDFSEATVLTMYLLSSVNLQLRPRILNELKPGTRVVSHAFMMAEWEPDEEAEIDNRNIFFWLVPAKAAGTWQWTSGGDTFTVNLEQTFQKITGTVGAGGGTAAPIQNALLSGDAISFEADVQRGGSAVPLKFEGKVMGSTIAGTATVGGTAGKIMAQKTA